ncbi:hypothetical protein Tco_1106252 [Tanacetum coccineum]
MRLKTDIKPKEATFQVVLDALALTPFYQAFRITIEVPAIYMQELWATVSVHKSSIRFMINKKKFSLDVEILREILQICSKIPRQEFEDLPLEQDILSFIRDLRHTGDITYLTDVNFVYLHQLWRAFASVINKCLSGKETRMDKIRLSCAQILWGIHEDTQVYGTILPKELTNQAMLESKAYKTYYAFASGEKTPKLKYVQKKADSVTSPKQKPVQATKGTRLKKKAKLATKRSKTQFHSSHASSSGDGVDTQSKVPDDQQQKTSGTDEGTGTKPGVPDVPIYESESEKESWGDSEDEDEDDENDSDDISDEGDDDNNGNNGNDGDDDDVNDDDKQEGDDTNDDDEETDSDRTESDRIKIPILDQSTTEYYEEEEEEKIDDEETMYDDEDDEVTKELYEDVNVNLGNEDTVMTNADQGAQNNKMFLKNQGLSNKLLNLENSSPVDNGIASLMETSARHAMAVPEITFGFTTTIPPPPPFFNPLLQHATPAPTPTTSEATTSFRISLLYSNSMKESPTWKKIYQRNNKLTTINKAIQAHSFDCREEAQAKKREHIELVDSTVRTIIKEEVNTQLPQILPQAILDVATPVIEKNVTESLEAAVLTRSSSQP